MKRRLFNIDANAFLKQWAFFAVAFIAGLSAFRWLRDSAQGDGMGVSQISRQRVERISASLESAVFRAVAIDFQNRAAQSDESVLSFLQAWVNQRHDVVTVEWWQPGSRYPVRASNDSMVQALEYGAQSASDQESLSAFLFPESAAAPNADPTGPRVDAVFALPDGPPLVCATVVSAESRQGGKASAMIKSKIPDLKSLLSSLRDPKEDMRLLNASEHELASLVGAGSRFGRKGVVRVPVSGLSWTLEWRQTGSAGLARPGGVFGLFLLLLICAAVSAASAAVMAWWIERPVRNLADTAFEIGRGNFSLRLPVQKNQSINRLARLINYMVEEMDHLQRMNVSAIVHEKNKTEAVLRHLADGVVVIDPDGRIAMLNRFAEAWLGLREKDAVRKPFREAIRNRSLLSLVQDVHEGGSEASTDFTLRHHGSRQVRTFLANATRAVSREGNTVGTVVVIRDVTQEKEADRLKTELISMVAHELKSPLTAMVGFCELLLEAEAKNKKAMEYATVILAEANRLTDFVNKFLSLSRLESGKVKIKMDPFDLKPVIEKAVGTLKSQADRKDICIVLQIPDPLPLVAGDPELVEQVLLNLIGNAIKYSPARSKVGIEVDAGDKDVGVTVIDNGYGIPKEALPRIFDKFYRVAEMEGEGGSEGSGLGLALVKEIVEKHGGAVRVKSKLGIGSVFNFSLLRADLKVKE